MSFLVRIDYLNILTRHGGWQCAYEGCLYRLVEFRQNHAHPLGNLASHT